MKISYDDLVLDLKCPFESLMMMMMMMVMSDGSSTPPSSIGLDTKPFGLHLGNNLVSLLKKKRLGGVVWTRV